jgi:hypothetical protein
VSAALLAVFLPWLAASSTATDTLWARAQFALSQRDCASVVKYLEELLVADPARVEARSPAADCLMKLGRPAEALSHYQEWAKARPGDPGAAAGVAAAQAELARRAATDRRDPTPQPTPTPSLVQLAQRTARTRQGEPARSYTLTGKPGPVVEPSPGETKRASDPMRERADAILRPRMQAVAQAASELRAGKVMHEKLCTGKPPPRPEGNPHTEEEWEAHLWSQLSDRVDCNQLAASIAHYQSIVDRALVGVDRELAQPPSVYPGVAAEVRAQLEEELW